MCIHWLHFRQMKDVGLRIRIDRNLREQFLKACQAEDKPAAQVLREFMRAYVADRADDPATSPGSKKKKMTG